MDKQNLMPNQAQPVNRNTTGQLPSELAELSEEVLQLHGDDAFGASVLPSDWLCVDNTAYFKQYPNHCAGKWMCSYDGDDAE